MTRNRNRPPEKEANAGDLNRQSLEFDKPFSIPGGATLLSFYVTKAQEGAVQGRPETSLRQRLHADILQGRTRVESASEEVIRLILDNFESQIESRMGMPYEEWAKIEVQLGDLSLTASELGVTEDERKAIQEKVGHYCEDNLVKPMQISQNGQLDPDFVLELRRYCEEKRLLDQSDIKAGFFGDNNPDSASHTRIAEDICRILSMDRNTFDKAVEERTRRDQETGRLYVDFDKAGLLTRIGAAATGNGVFGKAWNATKTKGSEWMGKMSRSKGESPEVDGDDLAGAKKRRDSLRDEYAKMQKKKTDPATLQEISEQYWAEVRKVQELELQETDEFKAKTPEEQKTMIMLDALQESHKLAERVNKSIVMKLGKIGRLMDSENKRTRWASRIIVGATLGAAGAALSAFVLPASGIGFVVGTALSTGARAAASRFTRSAGEVEQLEFAGGAKNTDYNKMAAEHLAEEYKGVSLDELGGRIAQDQREKFLNDKRDTRIEKLRTARRKAGLGALISVGLVGLGAAGRIGYDLATGDLEWKDLNPWSGSSPETGSPAGSQDTDAARQAAEAKATAAAEAAKPTVAPGFSDLNPEKLADARTVRASEGGLRVLERLGINPAERAATWKDAAPDLLNLKDPQGRPEFYMGPDGLRISRPGSLSDKALEILQRSHDELYPADKLSGALPDQPTPPPAGASEVLRVAPGGGGSQLLEGMGVSPAERLPTWNEARPELLGLKGSSGESLFYAQKVNGVEELRISRPGNLPPEVKGILASAHDRLYPVDKLPASLLGQSGGIDAPDVKVALDAVHYSQLRQGANVNALAKDLGIGKGLIPQWTEYITGQVQSRDELVSKYFSVAQTGAVTLRQTLSRNDLYELAKNMPRPRGVFDLAR